MANTTWSTTDKTANITLTGSNLTATQSASGANGGVRGGADGKNIKGGGKFYWETTQAVTVNIQTGAGICRSDAALTGGIGVSMSLGACGLGHNGLFYVDRTNTLNFGTQVNGSVVCWALDTGLGQVWLRVGAGGLWNLSATANPTSGSGGVVLPWAANLYPWCSLGALNDQVVANFGDTGFAGAVPGGFTPGWPVGADPLMAAATQVAAEHWFAANPNAQITQVALEHWMSVSTTNLQAIVTQVMLEHWTSVASVGDVTPASPQARVLVLA